MPEKILFWVMAPVALASAIMMIRARNAVHAALLLVLNFFALAVFYVMLDAQFLAAVQVIVYAGAIMVLFLFVIMLLGVDRREPLEDPIRFQTPLALVLGVGFIGVAIFTIHSTLGGRDFQGLKEANASGNVQGLGRLLFNKYMFPFEVASILLIVAAIGAMVLGRRRDEEEAASHIAEDPSAEELASARDEERV
jgi:NADH-quinone oxidoreductase subunit J